MKFTAPMLAGRMPPAIFTYLGIGKKERFPGDPWAHHVALPSWYWMHSDECRKYEQGSSHALCIDRRVASGLRETWPAVAPVQTPTPPARVREVQIDLFH